MRFVVVLACLACASACAFKTGAAPEDGPPPLPVDAQSDAPRDAMIVHDAEMRDAPADAVVVMVDAPADARPADARPADAAVMVDAMPDAAVMHDAAVDAMPDAGAGGGTGPLVAYDPSGAIPTYANPDVYANGTSSGMVFIYNAGSVATGALSFAIDGADAADFTMLSTGTTCTGAALAAGDGCWIAMKFAPGAAAPNTQVASLDITGASAPFSLPITGRVDATPTALLPSVAEVNLGDLAFSYPNTHQTVVLTNVSGAALDIGEIAVSGPFTLTNSCSASLGAGSNCSVIISYTGEPLGESHGALTVGSTTGTTWVTVLLRVGVLRLVTVAFHATSGAGDVVSALPSGTCGSSCKTLFGVDVPLGIPVQLSGTAAGGDSFVSWTGACEGTTPACTLASPAQGQVTANFAPSTTPTISIAFAGPGAANGTVYVSGGGYSAPGEFCTGPCVIPASSSSITLTALTPETFGGFSGGACSGTGSTCGVGAVTTNTAITATFGLDANEVGTIFLPDTATAVAVAPGGDVIIGTADGVYDLTTAGTVVWSVAIADGVHGLATDAAGDIVGFGAQDLFELTSGGAVMWSRAVSGLQPARYTLNNPVATSPDGTVIAVVVNQGIHVVDGSGTDRFVLTAPGTLFDMSAIDGVAVDASGNVAVIGPSNVIAEEAELAVYSEAGALTSSVVPAPSDPYGSVAFDATGAIANVSVDHEYIAPGRYTSSLAKVFQLAEDETDRAATISAGVLATPSGEVFVMFSCVPNAADSAPGGIELRSASGALEWSLAVPVQQSPVMADYCPGPTTFAIGGGALNRVAAVGTWSAGWPPQPYVQIFDLP